MLVTAEVTAFVVGPAISGLIIGLGLAEWSIWAAAGLAVVGWPLLHGLGARLLPSMPPGSPAGGCVRC